MKFLRITRDAFVVLVALVAFASAQAITTTTAAGTAANATATSDFLIPTATFILPPMTPNPSPAPTSPAPSNNSTLTSCPGPLIPNIHGLSIPTCSGPCCIKCPAVNSFFPPNQISRILEVAYAFRQVSLVLSIFMAISYIILPGKRNQPHISAMFLGISLAFWYSAFDVMPGFSNACANDFEESTGHNSKLCGVQGVLIIYLTMSSAIWCCMLIMKLHLLAVWRSDLIDRYYGWLTGFSWLFPLAFAIPVAVKNLSQYPGVGFSCMVSTDHLNAYVFYPTAIFVYPSMICHVVTVAKMIQIAMASSKIDGLSELSSNARMQITATMQAKRLIRGQWRPALMLATTMSSFTVFWMFYFLDARRLNGIGPTTPWVGQWLGCIISSAGKGLTSDQTQATCSKLISSHLFSVPWFAAAEILLALIGSVVSIVFLSKKELWSDWGFMITSIIRRGKMGTSSRGRGSSQGGSKSPETDLNPHRAQYSDRNNGGRPTRPGFSDGVVAVFPQERKGMPPGIHYSTDGTQWYDMDDLLDKEYEIQASDLNRNASFGSRTAMTSAPNQQGMADPPQYLTSTSNDPHSGDILYTPPVQERNIINSAWAPSVTTLVASPPKAYLVANDSTERYIEQPVVPQPVPRASTKSKSNPNLAGQQQQQQQTVYLSSPSRTNSPTFALTSLSPMPPKHSSQSSAVTPSRLPQGDSVPIVGTVRGSPSFTYTHPAMAASSSSGSKLAVYNSSDSASAAVADMIMVASRESVGRPSSRNQHQLQQSTDSVRAKLKSKGNTPSALDLRAKSPPPTIPVKSPARLYPQQQPLQFGQQQYQQYQQQYQQEPYEQEYQQQPYQQQQQQF